MEIIYFLLPIVILLAIAFVIGFVWMTKNGQYDDLETPAHRMLLDDQKLTLGTLNINPSINDLNKETK
jgi:cbb3-type cytochrome oxidase maturation protein